MTLEFGTLTCAEPGCDRTTPGALGITWTCPPHSGPPVWPAPHEPCSDDTDCGTTCYQDDGIWVYETTRGGHGYAVEDVQAYCRCEHHEVATRGELARGIGYRPARLPGAWWHLDPMAVRHHEARVGAAAMRSRAYATKPCLARFGAHECDPSSGPGADECWGPSA